jgi:hypothetical protein
MKSRAALLIPAMPRPGPSLWQNGRRRRERYPLAPDATRDLDSLAAVSRHTLRGR